MLSKLIAEISIFLKGKTCKACVAPLDVFFHSFDGQNEDEVDTIVQPDLIVVCDPDKLESNGCKGAPDKRDSARLTDTGTQPLVIMKLRNLNAESMFWSTIRDAGNL